ncbi:hypothetical protein FACS1894122_07650 [Alphaproteobacteria bacterium]|nr:hypothetical protein FACS1894122_07650 [Alphaproteobacteria bacterium]
MKKILLAGLSAFLIDNDCCAFNEAHRRAQPHVAVAALQPKAVLKKKRRAEQEKKRLAERLAERRKKRQEERKAELKKKRIEEEGRRLAAYKAELEKKCLEERKKKRIAERKAELEKKRKAERKANAVKVAAVSKSPVAKPAAQTTAARLAAQAALKRQAAALAKAAPKAKPPRVILEPARPKSAPTIGSRAQSPTPIAGKRSSSAPTMQYMEIEDSAKGTTEEGTVLRGIVTSGASLSCGFRAMETNLTTLYAQNEKGDDLCRKRAIALLRNNLDKPEVKQLILPEIFTFIQDHEDEKPGNQGDFDGFMRDAERTLGGSIYSLKDIYSGLRAYANENREAMNEFCKQIPQGVFEAYINNTIARRNVMLQIPEETGVFDALAYLRNVNLRIVRRHAGHLYANGDNNFGNAGSLLHDYRHPNPNGITAAKPSGDTVFIMYEGNNMSGHFSRAKVVGQ